MALTKPLLTRRAVLAAKLENTFGTNPGMDYTADVVLVNNPDFSPNFDTQQREFARDDISPLAQVVGREAAQITFQTELKGSGVQDSGSDGDQPRISRLLRACGLAETSLTSPEVSDFLEIENTGHADNPVTWSPDSASLTNLDDVITYEIKVVNDTSGSEAVDITPDNPTLDSSQTAVSITSGSSLTIGSKGLSATPTFTSLTQGQKWLVRVYPTGFAYDPVSDGFESISLELYFDGLKHEMTGAFGTFDIEMTAGQFPVLNFTFTGFYKDPVDAAAGEPFASSSPADPMFEGVKPPIFEQARLRVDDLYEPVINAMTFDLANDVVQRPSANEANSLLAHQITGRGPSGSIDPEARLVNKHDFWKRFKNAKQMPLQARSGIERGHRVWLFGNSVQYSGLSYGDRNGNRTFDTNVLFTRNKGNDEVRLMFT